MCKFFEMEIDDVFLLFNVLEDFVYNYPVIENKNIPKCSKI